MSLAEGVPLGILLMMGTIAVTYLYLKPYDLPARKWLANRFMYKKE